ncbi:MAG: polysaccharide biosynthesis C-terminal domain-containing protein [Saprospiraceae bacterium]|nr:polysaccharide biosynthesis C-terminal domain-containing protein [Saprospiraceae bacterium]
MSMIKKLAGETAIYGTSSILSRLLNYMILTPYLTRTFAEAEYGVVSILYTYAAILIILFTYRMETAFFRFGSRDGQLDKAFSTASFSLIFSTIAFSLLIWIGINPISEWLHFSAHPEYILTVLGMIGLDTLVAIPFARLRLENRPMLFAATKTLQIIFNIIFIFLFLKVLPGLYENGHAWAGWFYRAENRIGDLFLANLLANGIILLILSPVYLRIRWVFDPVLWKTMLKYAGPLIIVGFAAVVNQLIALPLLEHLLPGDLQQNRAQTGIFSAASKLAVLMNLFTQAFNYAAEPFFFRHAQESDSREIYAQVGYAFSLVGSVVFLGISLFLEIVKYFLGPDLRGGLGVVPILLMAYLFLGLYYNFSIWYKLADRTRYGAYISLGGVVITLLINFIFVPMPAVGYYAAAWAAFFCYFFMATASYLSGRSFYPINYPLRRMGRSIALAGALYILASGLSSNIYPNASLFFKLSINGLVLLTYIGYLWKYEGKMIRQLF